MRDSQGCTSVDQTSAENRVRCRRDSIKEASRPLQHQVILSFFQCSGDMSASLPEKQSVNLKETVTVPGISNISNIHRPDVDTSGVDERRLMRRVDLYVVPWLAVLYLLNFLDRGSIGNAKVSICSITSPPENSH